MLVDDDIYTKPDCSPMCNHQEVCSRCGRPHCIKSMSHSRLYGYACVCGSSEWEPVIKVSKAQGSLTPHAADDGYCHCPSAAPKYDAGDGWKCHWCKRPRR